MIAGLLQTPLFYYVESISSHGLNGIVEYSTYLNIFLMNENIKYLFKNITAFSL